jgi:hypothetical protein
VQTNTTRPMAVGFTAVLQRLTGGSNGSRSEGKC